MAKLVKPGVDRLGFSEGGRTYGFKFPVTTTDPEVLRLLRKRGAVDAPRPRPPSFPKREVTTHDADS